MKGVKDTFSNQFGFSGLPEIWIMPDKLVWSHVMCLFFLYILKSPSTSAVKEDTATLLYTCMKLLDTGIILHMCTRGHQLLFVLSWITINLAGLLLKICIFQWAHTAFFSAKREHSTVRTRIKPDGAAPLNKWGPCSAEPYLLRKNSLESVFVAARCLWKTGVGVAASAASGSSGEPSSESSTLKWFIITMVAVLPPETRTLLSHTPRVYDRTTSSRCCFSL